MPDDKHIKHSHPSSVCAVISLAGSSITSCCLRTSEGPGWTDPPPHHTQDRDYYPGPRLMTAESEKKSRKLRTVISVFKTTVIIAFVLFGHDEILWTTIIKSKGRVETGFVAERIFIFP